MGIAQADVHGIGLFERATDWSLSITDQFTGRKRDSPLNGIFRIYNMVVESSTTLGRKTALGRETASEQAPSSSDSLC